MYELPTELMVHGKSRMIRGNGDFRVILDCFNVLNDFELSLTERLVACLIIFYDEIHSFEDLDKLGDLEEAVEQMYWFFDCNIPQINQKTKDYKLIDWKTDELLVSSAINHVIGKEIRSEKYVHWWTFIGYYMAIGDCALSTVISIRHKIAENRKLEKHEKKFRAENPQYFTVDVRSKKQQEADAYVRSIWNSGKG